MKNVSLPSSENFTVYNEERHFIEDIYLLSMRLSSAPALFPSGQVLEARHYIWSRSWKQRSDEIFKQTPNTLRSGNKAKIFA
jgi:hypothetical protein